MTRKVVHISLAIIGFIVLTSKSCEPDVGIDQAIEMKAKQDSTLKELKNEFESAYLFEDKLLVYGEKAKQKLLDFADYLSMYSNKNIDTLFKQQIREMIYRLFYNDDAIIRLSVVPTKSTGNINYHLTNLLCSIDTSEYTSIEFVIANLKIVEPLHLESAERYIGKLGCRFRITGITENDTILLYETSNQVKIITTRTSKQFGTDTSLLVWQVFLVEVDAVN